MVDSLASDGAPPVGSRLLSWSWRWLVLDLVATAVVLGVSLSPLVRRPVVQHAVMVAVGILVAGALVLGFGVALYRTDRGVGALPDPDVRSANGEWTAMTRAERRGLWRALRRGRADRLWPEQRPAARWFAARLLGGGVPLATGNAGLATLQLALGLRDAPRTGAWWLHTAAGLLLVSPGVLAVLVAPGVRRSAAQLGVGSSPAGDVDHDRRAR